ncbi:hypothetical protein GCM10023084_40490 [Streptomyces lacrimifluminis]|uniref:Uncharacterized protein n=2 Tax=Streptomyces lacrimifluminis TaxID=1500077 RepID=A0A917L520_9ACTN|nr:hypothetical protein GCM10012282_42110 [Streptomyces lacrimifluminis]
MSLVLITFRVHRIRTGGWCVYVGMDLEKPAAEARQPERPERQPEGCLVVAIRLPVRIVVLVLVVPVRMVWDALVAGGRLLNDAVLRPLGRALAWVAWAVLVWPFVGLWRYVVVPLAKALGWLGNVLVVVPLVWLFRYVLTPLGHGVAWVFRGIGAGLGWLYARVLTPLGHGVLWVYLGIGAGLGWLYARVLTPGGHGVLWVLRGLGAVIAAVGLGVYGAAAWLVRYLVVVPARWLYAWVLTPVGRAIAWCARGVAWLVSMGVTGIGFVLYWVLRLLLVLPALALWRWVLTPVGRVLVVIGREVGTALGHAWRIAGHVSLAVGRFLGTLLRWIFVEPVRWVYLTVLTPVGHVVRDAVLRPAAEAARSVGRFTRQALAAARDSARQARADFRRMLFGKSGEERQQAVPVPRREPGSADGRTLGRSTTALTKD